MKATYLDSSAIVKLIVVPPEPESAALRRYLRRRHPLVSSGLAQTEVQRALMQEGAGPLDLRRAQVWLSRLDLRRVGPRLLEAAGLLLPPETRSLDAIHVATALELDALQELGAFVTYDQRMAAAALANGLQVVSPS